MNGGEARLFAEIAPRARLLTLDEWLRRVP